MHFEYFAQFIKQAQLVLGINLNNAPTMTKFYAQVKF